MKINHSTQRTWTFLHCNVLSNFELTGNPTVTRCARIRIWTWDYKRLETKGHKPVHIMQYELYSFRRRPCVWPHICRILRSNGAWSRISCCLNMTCLSGKVTRVVGQNERMNLMNELMSLTGWKEDAAQRNRLEHAAPWWSSCGLAVKRRPSPRTQTGVTATPAHQERTTKTKRS